MLNATVTQTGTEVFRAQTGGAYRIKGAYGRVVTGSSFPAKGSMPAASGLSGTITSTGTVVRGVGTTFLSGGYLTVGDFLYQKEVVRRITAVHSDTLLEIADAFPTDISVAVIPMHIRTGQYHAIYCKNVHASGAATIQEAPFAASDTYLGDGVPISYDAASGTLSWTLRI